MNTRLRKTSLVWLCAPLLVCGLGAATAADKPAPAGRPAMGFGLDANHDGSVDLAELQAREPTVTSAEFATLDTNHDGVLSRQELRAAMPKLRFMHLDTNKDGVVSADEARAEALANADARFRRLDRNGDGKLTPDELPGPGHERMQKGQSK
jgi:hypothetical protein